MASSSVSKQVNIKMRSIIQLARECIIDKLSEEIKKAGEDEELRNAFIKKQNDILELEMEYNDYTFIKIKTAYRNQPIKIPSEPVLVRGTTLKLMNMTNNMAYRKFCAIVATFMGYQPDFSDAPFNNLVKNTRVYEAIRRGYKSGKIDQDFLDQLVMEAEEEVNKTDEVKNTDEVKKEVKKTDEVKKEVKKTDEVKKEVNKTDEAKKSEVSK